MTAYVQHTEVTDWKLYWKLHSPHSVLGPRVTALRLRERILHFRYEAFREGWRKWGGPR